MPVMDGLEASAKILELNIGIPIVAVTANVMYNDRELYRQSGMNDCIGKPFTAQELWHCLMKYITPKRKDSKHMQIETRMESHGKFQSLFVEINKNKYAEITEAMEKGDIKLAHRLAHTLKGNAGQIGKSILQKAAADVEYQLKGGKNLVTGEQLRILKAELDMVIYEFTQKA
jgi:CheY-like chemotaxis protein